jgi:predicted nucleic acid-binding protein
VIYDTNFLIALQGRNKRFSRTQAKAWIQQNETAALYIPRVVEVEFMAGFESDSDALPLLGLFVVLSPGDEIWMETVRIARELRAAGQSIGLADSIIAATARLYALPLVTDNVKHLRRVLGLDVRGYME